MRNAHCENWSMVRKLKIMENEKHTVGHGIHRETLKNLKNEKCTVQDLEYGEKTEKTWKLRHKQCRIWNMARNTQKRGK